MRVAIGSGIVALTVCAMTAQKAGSTPTFTIDLLTAERPSEDPTRRDTIPEQDRLGTRVPRVGRLTDSGSPTSSLEVTLERMDRSAYSVGDGFIYGLMVTNVGKRAVVFPASLQSDRSSRVMAGARWAAIGLQVEDEMLGHQLVGLELLYGAQSVDGSLLNVGPGETVEIRAGGVWYFRSAFVMTPPQTWMRHVAAKGLLQIVDEHGQAPEIRSSNALTLSVKK
jgi:hypothetical protein